MRLAAAARSGWIAPILLLVAPLLGLLAAGAHGKYAVLAGGLVLLVAVVTIEFRTLPVLTIPCTLLIIRVGGSSTNLSLSDLVLFLGTLCALPLVNLRESRYLRQLLLIDCIYQATTLFTLIYNPYRANYVEWFHEAFLVSGSLIVGFVVGRGGRAKAAVTALALGAAFIALWACGYSLSHHFKPAYVLGMQKNYIGVMLSFAALVVYARPAWLGWRGVRWTRLVLALCLLGILASHSRQAMVTLAVGVGIMVLRSRELRRRSKAMLAAMVPLGLIALLTASHQLSSSNKFNSVHQRETWLNQSIQLWHLSPWFGVGLRWWYTSRFPLLQFQPPNAEAEMITSAGILGLIGFAVLIFGSLQVLRKVPPQYGTLALALLAVRVIQGQLDIFWVSATGSISWMLIGVILGVMALDHAAKEPPSSLESLGGAGPTVGTMPG